MSSEDQKLIYVRLLILLICNLIIGVTLYFSYQLDNIFSLFIYIGFGIVSLFQLIKMIMLKSLTAILISLISIASVIAIYGYFENNINKESFLKANMHGAYIDLKNDNSYIIKSGSWGSKKHYYGMYKYNVEDSVIILDKNINDGIINSNVMRISKFKNYIIKDNKYHRFLIQLDNNKNELRNKNKSWEFYRFEIK